MTVIKLHHNLSDDELDDVIKALARSKEKHSLKKVRLPAINPAQAHLSEYALEQYKKIMIQSLGKHLKRILEAEEPEDVKT